MNGWSVGAIVAFFVAFGALVPAIERQNRRAESIGGEPAEDEIARLRVERAGTERVKRALARLCIVADLPSPRVHVVTDRVPLTWTFASPLSGAEVWVTTGLLAELPDSELRAVLAHELSHLAHHDATFMSVLCGPPIWLLRSLRYLWQEARYDGLRLRLAVIMFGAVLVPPALVLGAVARVVSRHRELAADRGSALLTGSPAALAAALSRLSGRLERAPQSDLAAAGDLLHILPSRRREARRAARLWATHPPLEQRLAQLEELESALQHAGTPTERPPAPPPPTRPTGKLAGSAEQ